MTLEMSPVEMSPVVDKIVAFLGEIGIPVSFEPVGDAGFMPGMAIRDGVLLVALDQLDWPGDLLHEAGHIAVTDPAKRATTSDLASDPAEEMAAICWSYAAALAIGLEPAIVFHDGGYKGGGSYLADAFTAGSYIGLPMLGYYGMAMDALQAEKVGVAPFPAMQRWLR